MKRLINRLLPHSKQFAAVSDASKILNDFKPDLVVISLGDHNAGAGWTSRCRELCIPYMILVQLVKEGHCPPSDTESFKLLREGYRLAKRVFCTSHANRFLLEKQFAFSLPNLIVVNNPVKQLQTIPPYPESEVAQWAMVASLNFNHKGHDILFDVLRSEKWKERQINVNLYGSGCHEDILKKLADHWRLTNVSFRGHQPIEDIWRVNQILILPTRMEGLSLAFLEAMNCERSAIVTRVGDSERFIEDNVTGFLVRAPQADMLDEAMERAWQRRSEWRAMGRKARARIQEEITEDPVSSVANLIENFLA